MDDELKVIWEKALEELKNETSQIGYNTYIAVMTPRLVNKNTICFTAPSQYHIETCKTRYLDLIQNTLKYLTSIDYQIKFDAKDATKDDDDLENEIEENKIGSVDSATVIPPHSKSERANIKILKEAAGLNPRYSFENFVIIFIISFFSYKRSFNFIVIH